MQKEMNTTLEEWDLQFLDDDLLLSYPEPSSTEPDCNSDSSGPGMLESSTHFRSIHQVSGKPSHRILPHLYCNMLFIDCEN